MDAAQVLHEAAGYVEKGWVRGRLSAWGGRVCAMEAINRVFYGSAIPTTCRRAIYRRAVGLLAEVMEEQFNAKKSPESWETWHRENVITHVNDDLAKSRKEIIACMERAAARASE